MPILGGKPRFPNAKIAFRLVNCIKTGMKLLSTLIACLLLEFVVAGQTPSRWRLGESSAIRWEVSPGAAHLDTIEMSGLQISAILQYGVAADGTLSVSKKLVFPMLRRIPNDTHASLTIDFNGQPGLSLLADGAPVVERPQAFTLDGKLAVRSRAPGALETERTLFPSADKPALVELIHLKNTGGSPCAVQLRNEAKDITTDPAKGVYGQYIISSKMLIRGEAKTEFTQTLAPGETFEFAMVYAGRRAKDEDYAYSPGFELNKRQHFLAGVRDNLVLETPDEVLNREFAFAKIRATESIYDTKGGLMHGPGGGAYYAAIWANDQAEYADPFFPFLGNPNGNESALNSFRLFAQYMNPEFKPIPSSIIAEGTDFWNGAGDRGDMAMIAYGAARFALAYGRPDAAQDLWPLIDWCLQYLERKKTAEGVIASDSDELEGRFPAGKVNLSANALAYGAYTSAAFLADELGKGEYAAHCRRQAQELRGAIEKYFGSTVQGFDTYRYYDGNDKLRAWICLPLVMGIDERKDATIKALFSPLLWSANGILTESGSTTFWDRSTLYAFRGLFASGATDEGMKYFRYYSATRLLGEHVPYPVEAWPEGNQRHLSAESALYCRVVTEGLFGITPTGFRKFTVAPWLPEGWDRMNLRKIRAFGRTFDLEVRRDGTQETVVARLDDGREVRQSWSMKEPLVVELPQ